MVETGRVIKEVRRMYPVCPMPWRILTQDITVGSTVINAGTRVCLAYHETHQDASQYTDPAKCDPDRFGKDRAEDKKNSGWCYIPYGTGVVEKVHRCPTETLFANVVKAFAITFTKKCDWSAVPGQDFSLNDDLSFAGSLQMQIKEK